MKENGTEATKVAIIGAGARGLCVFERITRIYEQSNLRRPMEISWIDPGEYGQGVHTSGQPQYMLSNTVAGQISIFPGEPLAGGGPARKGWCLKEWAAAEGLRKVNGGYYRTQNSEGTEVGDEDYVPRGILGEYLSWAYDFLASDLPEGLSVRHLKNNAVDMIRLANGQLEIVLDGNYRLRTDYVFLTTGHGRNTPDSEDDRFSSFAAEHVSSNPYLRYFRSPYPMEQLKLVSRDATIAIQGLGLCAHDIIAELTVGRGGRFLCEGEDLIYAPSGREPRILVFSRSGLPYIGRAKGVDANYDPRFFTRAAIDGLRRQALKKNGSKQLDFETELWPLLVREMGFVYHTTKTQMAGGHDDPSFCVECHQAVLDLLNPHQEQVFRSTEEFTEKVTEYLRWDVEQVSRNGHNSPSQATTDLLRDMRRNLRYAIDFGGLTPESHRKVMQEYWPILSRLSAGPPKQRNVELLALLKAGVIAWAGGPNATAQADSGRRKFAIETAFAGRTERAYADVFIKARIDSFYPERDASPFIGNLLRSGLARPFLNGDYHPGGIDITEDHNPIGISGRVMRNVWALGNIVEGPNFFTHILPQTVSSGVIRDAGKCVLSMFAGIASGDSRRDVVAYSKSQ
jgi:uncharacterized NAD(P)/FAD-binding protein YdhS